MSDSIADNCGGEKSALSRRSCKPLLSGFFWWPRHVHIVLAALMNRWAQDLEMVHAGCLTPRLAAHARVVPAGTDVVTRCGGSGSSRCGGAATTRGPPGRASSASLTASFRQSRCYTLCLLTASTPKPEGGARCVSSTRRRCSEASCHSSG